MVRKAPRHSSSPTARAAAPEEAAPLPEATPNSLNFKIQSSNKPARRLLHVMSRQAWGKKNLDLSWRAASIPPSSSSLSPSDWKNSSRHSDIQPDLLSSNREEPEGTSCFPSSRTVCENKVNFCGGKSRAGLNLKRKATDYKQGIRCAICVVENCKIGRVFLLQQQPHDVHKWIDELISDPLLHLHFSVSAF